MIAGLASILVVAFVFRRFFVALPLPTRARFLLAATIYVSGELGTEMIGGWYTDHYGATGMVFTVLTATEETLGLLGIGIALSALLSYVREEYGDMRVHLGNRDRIPDRPAPVETFALVTVATTALPLKAETIGDAHATR